MTRIYVPPEVITGERIILRGQEFRHLARVLKMGLDDEVTVFDGCRREYQGRITSMGRDFIRLDLLPGRMIHTEPEFVVVLYQGLLKGEKYDWLVHKAVELGVSRIVPFVSARSVMRGASPSRLKRWRDIAVSAACLSGRGLVPEVTSPVGLEAALRSIPAGEPVLFFWESARFDSGIWDLKEALGRLNGDKGCHIFIGPEGGFSLVEVKLASEAGAMVVNLGPRTMKSETAGMVAVSLVLFEMGELSPKKKIFSAGRENDRGEAKPINLEETT